MFCNKCGTENPNDAVFCSGCGAELVRLQQEIVSSPNSQTQQTQQIRPVQQIISNNDKQSVQPGKIFSSQDYKDGVLTIEQYLEIPQNSKIKEKLRKNLIIFVVIGFIWWIIGSIVLFTSGKELGFDTARIIGWMLGLLLFIAPPMILNNLAFKKCNSMLSLIACLIACFGAVGSFGIIKGMLWYFVSLLVAADSIAVYLEFSKFKKQYDIYCVQKK